MKISTKWIKQFTDIKLENDELVRRIGAQLGAVEQVENWSSYYDESIVVAEIVSADDHKEADKLGIYQVKIGNSETRTLVAGDKKLIHGDKVAYIPPGAAVPESVQMGEPFIIQEREIRGQISQGMLGSAKELILGSSHSSVLRLDTDAAVGTPLLVAYELDDLIIDVENKMFTHRPDLFGILGLAREIAGIQDLQFKSPDWYSEHPEFENAENTLPLNVEVHEPELGPRVTALSFTNIDNKPSPIIMQSYLMRVGLRPINSVVDITNFAMYLTAQPSHAFDYEKIDRLSKNGPKLIIRKPNKAETITLLDGRELEPHKDAALIATDKQAVAIGGCMGGNLAEVDENTKNIILMVESWDLFSIRKTSFKHGIFTDAVTRFSKGQSPRQCLTVLHYMVGLLSENVGATVASNLIDEFPTPPNLVEIEITNDFINLRLGSSFDAESIARLLKNVELGSEVDGDKVKLFVPFWRTDLHLREDIVEEVGRLYGYDNLPIEVPTRKSKPNLRSDDLRVKGQIAHILSSAGANEVLTYNFVSTKLFNKAGYGQDLVESAYRIRNSISPELEYMRISLLPSVTEKVNQNIRSGYGSFTLFELNKSHNNKQVDKQGLPFENKSLALVVASDREQNGSAYYQAKAYLDHLCKTLGLDVVYRDESDGDRSTPLGNSVSSLFTNVRSAAVEINGQMAGFVGEFSSQAKANFKLPSYCAGFEVDMNYLHAQHQDYTPITRFPSSTQDVTLETPDQVEYSDLEHLVVRSFDDDDFTVSISPVSIFLSKPGELRRITFRLKFQAADRTLKTAEINEAVKRMVGKTSEIGIKQI